MAHCGLPLPFFPLLILVNVLRPEHPVSLDPKMPPLSQDQVCNQNWPRPHISHPLHPPPPQARYVRQLVLAGLGDHVARKIPTQGMNTEDKKRLRYAYQVPDVLLRATLNVLWVWLNI